MSDRLDHLGGATTVAVVFWMSSLIGYLVLLWGVTEFSFFASYDDLKASADLYSGLPLVVQQVSHNIAGIVLILKLALLIIIYASWEKRTCRWLICAWIVTEILVSVLTLGPRTPMLLFLVANVLLYHRFVQTLSLGKIAALALLLTCGALIIGFIRDYLQTVDAQTDLPVLSVSNEFQAVFATGYDLAQRHFAGELSVPWQIHVADLLRLIPQQILPFEKIEPADWYLRLIGAEGIGVGYMFGAIAESLSSGDWAGLGMRGVVLGAFFAFAHNWYTKRKQSFYVTLSYLWLCLHAYYSMRASTLYILVWVIYRLIPALALIEISRNLIRMARLSSPGRFPGPMLKS